MIRNVLALGALLGRAGTEHEEDSMTFALCMWLLIAPPLAILAISGGRDTAHARR
jgi:hypothetical protein